MVNFRNYNIRPSIAPVYGPAGVGRAMLPVFVRSRRGFRFSLRRLMNFVQHPMPARAARPMEQRVFTFAEHAGDAAVGIVVGSSLHGPIDYKRAAHHGVAVYETPVAAIPAAIAVVAHHEVTVGRN